jgi:hypothetical protein
MRKLTQLWRALERIPGLLHVPAFWESECGDDFALIQPYLRPTNEPGSRYPCPSPKLGDCPRRIIDYGNGEWAAICRDERKICNRVSLTPKEALLHELDLAAFIRPVLEAASIRPDAPKRRVDGVWSVGLSQRRGSLNQPAFLFLFSSSAGFDGAARDLLLEVPGQFLIVAPSNRYRGVDLQERLQARGISYVCLEDQILVDDKGRFTTIDPLESADKVPVTPIADRKRVVTEFTSKHGCKVREIQEAAGVDESDYYKWRSGQLPDHYAACQSIERILYHGLPIRRSR